MRYASSEWKLQKKKNITTMETRISDSEQKIIELSWLTYSQFQIDFLRPHLNGFLTTRVTSSTAAAAATARAAGATGAAGIRGRPPITCGFRVAASWHEVAAAFRQITMSHHAESVIGIPRVFFGTRCVNFCIYVGKEAPFLREFLWTSKTLR